MAHYGPETEDNKEDLRRSVRMGNLKSKGYSDRDAVLKSNKQPKKMMDAEVIPEEEVLVEDDPEESYAPTLVVEVDQLGGSVPEVGSQMMVSGTATVKGLIEKEDGRQCVEFEFDDFEVLPSEETV